MIGKAGMMSRRPAITVPSPPTNASVSSSNSTSVYDALNPGAFDNNNPVYGGTSDLTVDWSAPLHDGGSPITGYRVRGVGDIPHPSQIVSASTFFKQMGAFLWPARFCGEYEFHVTAINAVGESLPAIVSFRFPPLPANAPTVLRAFTEPVYGSYQSTYELAWAPICFEDSNNGLLRRVVPGANGLDAFADPTGDFTLLPYTHWQIQSQQTIYNNWSVVLPQPFVNQSPYVTCERSQNYWDQISYDVHQRKWRIRTAREADGELYYGAWSNVEITEP